MKKLKKKSLFLIYGGCLLVLWGCSYGGGGAFISSGTTPNTRINDSEIYQVTAPTISGSTYTFLVLSDIHIGHEPDDTNIPYEQIAESIQAQKNAGFNVDFVIILGDQTDLGLESEFIRFQTFTTWLKTVTNNAEIYNIAGNHDLYNDGWEHWKKYSSPNKSFYKFTLGNLNRTFYFLDTASGTLGTEQFRLLKQDIESNSTKKFIATHYPIYSAPETYYFLLSDVNERAALLSFADKNNVTMFFSGHFHQPQFYTNGSFAEMTSGSLKLDSENKSHWTFVTVNESTNKMNFKRYSKSGTTVETTNWTH